MERKNKFSLLFLIIISTSCKLSSKHLICHFIFHFTTLKSNLGHDNCQIWKFTISPALGMKSGFLNNPRWPNSSCLKKWVQRPWIYFELETAVALEPYQSYSRLSLEWYLCLMLSEQRVQSPDHIFMLGFIQMSGFKLGMSSLMCMTRSSCITHDWTYTLSCASSQLVGLVDIAL